MQIISSSPYPCTTYVWRDRSARFHRVCVMTGKFDILSNGALQRSALQTGPNKCTEYYGIPGVSSVRIESDLAPRKVAGEFYLVDAVAWATQSQCSSFEARVSLGAISHAIRINGKRSWRCRGGHRWLLGKPKLIRSAVPIRYEAAFGGFRGSEIDGSTTRHAENPVGTGFQATAPGRAGELVRCHRLESIDDQDRREESVVGFTPLDRGWQPRASLLGTIDNDWIANRWPIVPENFSYKYFQASPTEMRLPNGEYFRGDELIQVEGIQTNGWSTCRLSDKSEYQLIAFPSGQKPMLTLLNLDTVVVNLAAGTLNLTWRGSLPLVAQETPAIVTDKLGVHYIRRRQQELRTEAHSHA